MVQSGKISKTAKVLTSQGSAPESDDVLQTLKLKHPEGSIDSICLNKSVFVNAIKHSPRGSGCGLSGWRYEHVRILLDTEITFDSLLSVCNTIASGDVPHMIMPLLSASKLMALPKYGSDVRPIAIGEVFRRLTAKTISQQKSSDFSSFFSPLQHGIDTPEGGELLTPHLNSTQKNPDWLIL